MFPTTLTSSKKILTRCIKLKYLALSLIGLRKMASSRNQSSNPRASKVWAEPLPSKINSHYSSQNLRIVVPIRIKQPFYRLRILRCKHRHHSSQLKSPYLSPLKRKNNNHLTGSSIKIWQKNV